MKRFSSYLLAASLAIGGVSLTFPAVADDLGTSVQKAANAVGDQLDMSTQGEIRSTLANIVNDCVTPNRFDNLNGYLTKADKDRMADMKTMNVDDLNNAINQFRADFKNKYNQDFDIQNQAFDNAMITAGQDKKSATVTVPNADLSNTSGTNLNSNPNNPQASNYNQNNSNPPAASSTPPEGATINSPSRGDVTLNRNGTLSGQAGKAVNPGEVTPDNRSALATTTNPPAGSASVSTPHATISGNPGYSDTGSNYASNNPSNTSDNAGNTANNAMAAASGATLNLVNEGHVMNAWRLDIPNQITADQLRQNLIKHIQMIDDQKATWPSDVNKAYQATAYHVLQAFNDSSFASER